MLFWIPLFFVSVIEAVSVEYRLQPRRRIDENERIVDELFLAAFGKRPLCIYHLEQNVGLKNGTNIVLWLPPAVNNQLVNNNIQLRTCCLLMRVTYFRRALFKTD